MNINEFISTLPSEIVLGKELNISSNVFRKLFVFGGLSREDIFYYLNFGNNYNALSIAKKEFNVKEVYGIYNIEESSGKQDKDIKKIGINILNKRISDIDLSNATVIFCWVSDINHSRDLIIKFEEELKKNARILTLFSPLGSILPVKVSFPFILSKKPFHYATDIKEQIKKIYGKECIDFTSSWLLSEKYVKEMEIDPKYSRFTIMLMSMILWINAWNLKITCEEIIPPPVESYQGILRTFFNIDLKDMFVDKDKVNT
ncbi:MAG: hypothetical protein ACE5SW_00460 [Nitrososphaeraceae archaeon]